MAGAASGEEQEEGGPLVFQRGKKLNEEYYIISVRDNAEGACVQFSAYELETSETYPLNYSYADFDALFKTHPELVNATNREGRYDCVVDRLDFMTEGSGLKRLTLASEPTAEDEDQEGKPSVGPSKLAQKDRLTYAERLRLRQEAEKLEEKRAQSIATKSEKNRKAFVAELQEKRKLEELKAQSRKQRIDEERAERREKAEMERHVNEEKQRRYAENDKKREERIHALEDDRKRRESAEIRELVESAAQKKAALAKKLEEARLRKWAEEEAVQLDLNMKRGAEQAVQSKRDAHITGRQERIKKSEKEYLELRDKQIGQLAEEKVEKETRKQEYLREKAGQRAAQLREKHEKIEAWEQAEDLRTQNNMKKEHARNQLMLDHIESLRQQFSQEQAEATARKQASLEQRKEREAKEACEQAEVHRLKGELATKREENILLRDASRQENNQNYCNKIRDMKTSQAMQMREQHQQVEATRVKTRDEKVKDRETKAQQEAAAAHINTVREENIRKKEQERDKKFAHEVKDRKEKDTQHAVDIEARKHQHRQQDKEKAQKREEEEQAKKRQAAILEDQREQMIKQRASERNKREQERHQGQLAPATPSGGGAAAAETASSIADAQQQVA